MEVKTIELAGIVRNLPDNRVADGTMQEIINLRPEDGAWRPVGPKESVPMTAADIRYIHTVNESYKVYWGTPGGNLYYWVYENGAIQATVNTGYNLTGKSIMFAQLHKTVILSNNTDKTMITFVFDTTTERYGVFDGGFPELPIMVATLGSPVSGYPFPGTITKTGQDDSEEALATALSVIEQNNKHTFTGPVALRFAWELVDGTIVKHSAPMYLTTSYFQLASSTSFNWIGKYIQLTTTTSSPDLIAISQKWKGIIKNLNVYVTRPQTPTEGVIDILPVFKDLALANESSFYLVKSIPIDQEPFLVLDYLLDDYREIETFPTMPTDNFTHHTIHGASLFPYNERIFLGDITTRLYNNFSPADFLEPIAGGVTGSDYIVSFEIDLLTSDGMKTMVYAWDSINYYKSSGEPDVHAFQIKRFFSYPDARATTLRIIVDPVVSGAPTLVATLKLTPHSIMNFAWYNEQSLVGTEMLYGYYKFVGPLSSYPEASFSTIYSTYRDTNRVQLTEQSNPFAFPAINSYRIGNGNIIGMATNAVALSQGQFGQFPVYCFTGDGIWAMTIGSGDPLIQSIVPVSREVCNNARSITQIDGGVLYTTAKGLYILSGANPIELSEPAEGAYLSRLTGTVNYEAIANNPNLYQVKAYLCNTDFLSYLASADIGYDHVRKEIIVTNPAKSYSWVYSLRAKAWFKISQSFERFVTDFPNTYGYKTETVEGTTPFLASSSDISASDDTVLASAEYIEGAVYNYLHDITVEDFSELVPVHMETRPIKISARKFKKIHRMLIDGIVNDSLTNPFSVNLFGSPDNKDWYLMNNGNAFASKSRLLIGRCSFSSYYFILIFGGKVDEEAYFTHLEVEFEEKYGNRLR